MEKNFLFVARWLAPTGGYDIALKSILISILIHAASLATEFLLFGTIIYAFWPRLALTVITSLPFVVFALCGFAVAVQSRQRLRELADSDALTGLSNRRAFLSAMADEAKRNRSGYLLLLDGDAFKLINDTLGHATGDRALQAIAAQLAPLISPDLTVARLGGDEFGILLTGDDPDSQLARVEQLICGGVGFNQMDGGQDLVVFLSAGAAAFVPARPSALTMREADKALYAAKKLGGARLMLADCSMQIARSA
ncbi:GGDEF domain-containing protein [Loktanella sp. SALINAS62]|uniref:GGDEF domain-containing protein n=1 Tax=Loktanella sp. SALINAS62 TaxID=2706124 RepID=UPI001B8C12A0|nr:GGDEF domain-containing protein [Loktanella sp. SALINAS62]MBS1303512.1 GGDEF domain-containing protein [Loktanella sp. SALINAS62]